MALVSVCTDASTLVQERHHDPRVLFERALALATDVIAEIGPEQLDDPTPCQDFDVRQLLEHLVDVVERVGEIGRGDDAVEGSAAERYVDDHEWLAAWCDAAAGSLDVWTDDTTLERMARLPWAELPGRTVLAVYLNEVTVHTWDLAMAAGQHPTWDDEVVMVAFDAVRLLAVGPSFRASDAVGTPTQAWGPAVPPFADAFEVDAGAPLLERLVAWNGRRP